ncbi:THO complex subunit 7 homolog [Uloborus diversus]|uniref:THO complex subunit 7 homolog n=1 Tax=Uloborus diversus TaxID=327109 RepID=UPI0024099AA6|nr:THO complex subunit 7 homolog [Uloborus diversus]
MSASSQGVIQIGDDEVFRRKLLMDGEGMGDDRRINILLKSFFKWADGKNESEEEIFVGYERLLTSLANCEFLMFKSQQAQIVNSAEINHYEELYSEIENKIAEAQNTILQKKSELQQSKRVRKNKQQYDALARIIAEQPDRKETHSKLEALGEEIANLEKEKQELQMRLEKRHKQFKVLLSAAHQLQQIIKSEEDTEMDMD